MLLYGLKQSVFIGTNNPIHFFTLFNEDKSWHCLYIPFLCNFLQERLRRFTITVTDYISQRTSTKLMQILIGDVPSVHQHQP